MGLLATIANALGLRPALRATAPGAFTLDPSVAAAVADGSALHVSLAPSARGYLVHAHAGPPRGPTRDVGGVPVVARDADLEKLHGLTLVHRDGRFLVGLELSVRAAETPNPDGRLYTLSRPLHRGRPRFFAKEDRGAPEPARGLLAIDGVKSVLLRDNTVAIERVKDTPWGRLDAAVDASIREHFLSCGGVLEAGDDLGELDEGALTAAVRRVIADDVLPGVHGDGGHIELVDVRDGVVRVHMEGACKTCPASSATLQLGVEAALKRALGDRVVRVEQV